MDLKHFSFHIGDYLMQLFAVLSVPVVSVLAIKPEARRFKTSGWRWVFKGDKHPWHAFLRRGSNAVVPCRKILRLKILRICLKKILRRLNYCFKIQQNSQDFKK
jgi:hypothetical protein